MRAAAIAIALAACQSGNGTQAAGSAAAPGAAAPGSAAAGSAATADVCTPIKMCAAFPQAHIDQLCGVKTVTTTALDEAPRENAMVDSCQYNDAEQAPLVYVGRTCIPGAGGGTAIATQLFGVDRGSKPATDIQLDLQSIGDQGYFRVSADKTHASVAVRKGNTIITIRHMAVTPATAAAIQKDCLLGLYREAAGK